MNEDRYRFRLLAEHQDSSTGIESWDRYHEWFADDRIPEVRRDSLGRSNANGGWSRWGTLRCNNGVCPARALFRTDIVEQAAAEWEARRSGGAS